MIKSLLIINCLIGLYPTNSNNLYILNSSFNNGHFKVAEINTDQTNEIKSKLKKVEEYLNSCRIDEAKFELKKILNIEPNNVLAEKKLKIIEEYELDYKYYANSLPELLSELNSNLEILNNKLDSITKKQNEYRNHSNRVNRERHIKICCLENSWEKSVKRISWEVTAMKASEFEKNKDYDSAIIEYEKSIQKGIEVYGSYLQIGGIYDKKGNYIKAIEVFKKALEIEPKIDNTYIILSYMYEYKIKDLDKAIEMKKKVLELNPNEQYYKNELKYLIDKRNKLK